LLELSGIVGGCRGKEWFVEAAQNKWLQSCYVKFVRDMLFVEHGKVAVYPCASLGKLSFGCNEQNFVGSCGMFNAKAPGLLKDGVI